MQKAIIFTFVLLMICLGCSPAEKAEDLAALSGKSGKSLSAGQMKAELESLRECCDENARSMGAECCLQLDQMMSAHSSSTTGQADSSFQAGRSINVPPEVAKRWIAVLLKVSKKDGTAQEVTIKVGEEKKIDNTPLSVKIEAFLPSFSMNEQEITSRGAQPVNPAARVRISEEGQADWSGWLFAKMPDVHSFPHESWRVELVGGLEQE